VNQNKTLLLRVAASVVLSSLALDAQRDLAAGFGAQSLRLELNLITGEDSNLGVQHLGDEIFTTARNRSSGHRVNVFDAAGNLLRSWLQPGLAQVAAGGFRDGASDGRNLCWGFDFGIQLTDADGTVVESLQTQNGTQAILGGLISGNVLQPDQAGIIRALAYDPSGDGGNGSFWTGNFGSSTFEIDTSGDILTTYANAGESSYGFAIDPIGIVAGRPTTMWINSAPNAGPIAEYDLTTGTLTGRIMEAGGPNSGIQGGLDVMPGSVARGATASGWDLVHVEQSGNPNSGNDELRIRRLHLDAAGTGIPPSPVTRPGFLEPEILSSVDDEVLVPRSDLGVRNYTIDSFALSVFFDIANNPGDGMGTGGLNGTSAVIYANIGADAVPNATGNLLGIRELVHLQPQLTVPQPLAPARSMGMVLSNDPVAPSANEWRAPLVPGVPFQAIGACVRLQGLWVDSDVALLPIAMTNQLRLCCGPDPIPLSGAFAVFQGTNTFNANTSAGFFRVINEEIDPNLSIVGLTMTILPSSPSAATQALFDSSFRWDTNNPGMADVFAGGDSKTMGCSGTYRNNSDVTTGLIFAGTAQQNLGPCDLSAQQGWIGSDDGPTAFGTFVGDWLTLEFAFAPDTFMGGATFEFDADTDGGLGTGGSSLAGVIVEVAFRNGSISAGEIVADANDPNRGFVQL